MTAPAPSTDRRIREAGELEALAFDARGLVPVVTQDAGTGEVLMVAWADREALQRTLATGTMHYHSRSRDRLWRKGETSGNTLALVSLHADCDADTVLARVRPAGPACHTGEVTCFGADTTPEGASDRGSILSALWSLVEDRDRERPEGSYTTRLLDDENLRLKKLGEEMAELIVALSRGDERAAEEGADLVYHLMVALRGAGRSWRELEEELARRKG